MTSIYHRYANYFRQRAWPPRLTQQLADIMQEEWKENIKPSDGMTTEEGLITAFKYLPPQEKEARVALIGLILQRGCEESDPAVRDGKLTTYCDIAIYG